MRSLHIAFLLASLLLSATELYAQVLRVVPAETAVDGVSQIDWSRNWWQWAASYDGASSPVADRTGVNCRAKQEGNVWFLAGAYGSKRVTRACTVPAGKYLFFPLVNYVIYPQERANPPKCSALLLEAEAMTDDIEALVLDLDGDRATGLEKHRLATRGCFDLGAKANPRTAPVSAAANGYYVMLEPLPRGRYELNFGGILPGVVQAITYHLMVE